MSGESGAGKTVNAKFAMRYFASVGGASDETQIEKKILASNPVMEALGNAKTTRNDNSSRFGKYIEILFSVQDEIVGANMRTYLLEKSRLVFQSEAERNYHVFYQLCALADDPAFEDFELAEPEEFFFTKQGGEARVKDVDDAEEFAATREAMSLLGISTDFQHQVFRSLAGLLHLGNVDVIKKNRRSDDSKIADDDSHIAVAARLLGLEEKSLRKWLTNRSITTRGESFVKPLLVDEAVFTCHALAKHVYSYVFGWLVERLNESLAGAHAPSFTLPFDRDADHAQAMHVFGHATMGLCNYAQPCHPWPWQCTKRACLL